jgi:hypothetical protein
MRKVPALSIVMLFGLLAGCSHFEEMHYFQSETGPASPPNYFRVRVSGGATMSSSRYLSGYFDESAVDRYFSEIAQPKSVDFVDTVRQTEGTTVKPVDPQLKDKSLLMILSSNADAVTEGIGGIVEGDELSNMIVSIARHSDNEAVAQARARLRHDQSQSAPLVQLGDDLVSSLPDDADRSQARQQMLQYFNAVAARFGARPFTTLAEAAAWLDANRVALVGE